MTLVERCRQGEECRELSEIASRERVALKRMQADIATGRTVVLRNSKMPKSRACAVGAGLRVKVNANIGTSPDYCDVEEEVRKLKCAVEAGADTVMDLSTGGDLREIRKALLLNTPVPLGTVPVYDLIVGALECGEDFRNLPASAFIDTVRTHAESGVDFVTVHAGITLQTLNTLDFGKRVCGVVSRGGTIVIEWMRRNAAENPLYEYFDELLEIAAHYDMTLSLGDGLRPGSLADSLDGLQVAELMTLAGLRDRALEKGVQVMIEGPGHVPLHQIQAQVQLAKEVTKGAPFYVLGPLVTDIAPGYDHITGAIGGALAAWAGADFLCYVTPSEHLALPCLDDVREGVIAARIAAHAADIARGIPGAAEHDRKFSNFRRNLDWNGMLANCIDPVKARRFREARPPHKSKFCSMCGELCVFEIMEK